MLTRRTLLGAISAIALLSAGLHGLPELMLEALGDQGDGADGAEQGTSGKQFSPPMVC